MQNLFNFSFPDTKKYQAYTEELQTIRREFIRPMQVAFIVYAGLKVCLLIEEHIGKTRNLRDAKAKTESSEATETSTQKDL